MTKKAKSRYRRLANIERATDYLIWGSLDALGKGQEITNDHMDKAFEYVVYLNRLARKAK